MIQFLIIIPLPSQKLTKMRFVRMVSQYELPIFWVMSPLCLDKPELNYCWSYELSKFKANVGMASRELDVDRRKRIRQDDH